MYRSDVFFIFLLAGLLSGSGTFGKTTDKIPPSTKPKVYVTIEPRPAEKEEVYTAEITASLITARFTVPKRGYANAPLAIQYHLSGVGLAAVEATAFENPNYLSRRVYTTSAFPKDMEIAFNYLGAIQTKKSGEYAKSAFPKLNNRLQSNRYYRLFFEIRNIGKTLLKSRGFGKISYRLDVVNSVDNKLESGTLLTPKTAIELYPAEKQEVSYLIGPLLPGEYLIKMLAFWNDIQIIAETDLPITVVDKDMLEVGAVMPERIPYPELEMFSKTVLNLQEPLHAFRIHELKDPELLSVSGLLLLPLSEKDCPVIVRLLTPYQTTNASFLITVEKPKKKKRY